MQTRQIICEAIGLLVVGVGFFLLASLFSFHVGDDVTRVFPVNETTSNLGGMTGFKAARELFRAFGVIGGYTAGILICLLSFVFLTHKEPTKKVVQGLLGSLTLILTASVIERLLIGTTLPVIGHVTEDLGGRLAGGYWGIFIETWVSRSFSSLVLLVLVAAGFGTGLAMAMEYFQHLWTCEEPSAGNQIQAKLDDPLAGKPTSEPETDLGAGDSATLDPQGTGQISGQASNSTKAKRDTPEPFVDESEARKAIVTNEEKASEPPQSSLPKSPREAAFASKRQPTAEIGNPPGHEELNEILDLKTAALARPHEEFQGASKTKAEKQKSAVEASAKCDPSAMAVKAQRCCEAIAESSQATPELDSGHENGEVAAEDVAGKLVAGRAKPYQRPSMDLLEMPEELDDSSIRAEIAAKARLIEECLKEFRIEAKVEHIERGPNVTLYALTLGKGIKVQRISALLDNLALVLAAPGAIRLQAPIRGTSWVGLEVPNEKQELVSFAEIYRQPGWRDEQLNLPIFLGKDTAGRPLLADLAKLPHLLVAGATGSGKSVCINTMILSLLMTRSPEEVKLILIDPKQVELAPFSEIPHLLSPVVTDMRHAGAALDWAVQKMEERYNFLARARVRHLRDYNKLGQEGLIQRMGLESEADLIREAIPWKLPYIVVVVDELNDLMMVAQKEVEASIMRLAQKSRAIGIHVILATQRPSVDVITGVIKSNLPARLAFQVTSKVDSRTILDVMGAEKLLGMGDMLFLPPGRSQPIRAKGAYVSENELERVLTTVCDQREPEFAKDLVALKDQPEKAFGSSKKERGRGRNCDETGTDELFEEAVEVVLTSGRGSVSLIQRKLGVGYARAARMIQAMFEQRILGGERGSKARKVLMSLAEWQSRQD